MNLFRQTVFQSLAAAVIAGLLLTLIQQLGVTPLILEAEQYEIAEPVSIHSNQQSATAQHDHHGAAWAPDDGFERHLFTLISNTMAAFGFALLLIAAIRTGQIAGRWQRVSFLAGLSWGGAGFLVFFAAPSLGLPPEIPGMVAAELEARQVWWVFCASSTAVALAIIALAPLKWKTLGLLPLLLPHLVGAPQMEGPHFVHPDPAAVQALTAIHQQFIWATGITNALYWLLLGALCCGLISRAPLDEQLQGPA
ncbi:CbtA family protein [Aestuariirhabdus sp. LZHN29]|uniref:CbtA family protein n=1 Tax=Aestuariirhabdus sp. LZHN29 TaxID=3417462 RepID=UPI003CF4D905